MLATTRVTNPWVQAAIGVNETKEDSPASHTVNANLPVPVSTPLVHKFRRQSHTAHAKEPRAQVYAFGKLQTVCIGTYSHMLLTEAPSGNWFDHPRGDTSTPRHSERKQWGRESSRNTNAGERERERT